MNLFLTCCLLLASASFAAKEFPFPKFKEDFFEIAGAAKNYARAKRGQEIFNNLTLPYAPLDLSHQGKASDREIREYRNFVFGFLGAAFGANPKLRSSEYFCSPKCWVERKANLIKSLDKIESLSKSFRSIEGVKVLSHWNIDGKFRINSWIIGRDSIWEEQPSRNLQIRSSGKWRVLNKEEAKNVSPFLMSATPLIDQMKKYKVIGLIKGKGDSVIVVLDGFADNAWGLIVSSKRENESPTYVKGMELIPLDTNTWLFMKGGRRLISI